MSNNGSASDETVLVASARADRQLFADTAKYFGEDSLAIEAWADLGASHLGLATSIVPDATADRDLRDYFGQVSVTENAAWMDNTTILTACTLMSSDGSMWITPLSLWDLVTWFRSVVCHERIYHHDHPLIDDQRINALLGETVLNPIQVPYRDQTDASGYLPVPFNGATYYMCLVTQEAITRLRKLRSAVGAQTVDGRELAAVSGSWSAVLDRSLQASDIVDPDRVDHRFLSPSNGLLQQMTDAVRDIDYDQEGSSPAPAIDEHNFRAQLNQRFANDFHLPYATGISRAPFRRHLAARAARIQEELLSVRLLDRRYEELAPTAVLRVPAFLALALKRANSPADLWPALADQREAAVRFRSRRAALDAALADGDIVERRQASKALHTEAEHFSSLVGDMLVSAATAVTSQLAQGTPDQVSVSVAAAEAAVGRLISSSLADRILWRLRRPQLLYLNNIIDEARHITDALSASSRVWQIAERDQRRFAERFYRFKELQSAQ